MPQAVQSRKTKSLPPEANPARRLLAIRLLFLCGIVLVFGRIVFNDFVDWDDTVLIIRNHNITNPTLHSLAREWNPYDPSAFEMYDPLVYTVWWTLSHGAQVQYADVLDSHLNPQVYHGANLIVHWLTVCVVFEILRRLGFRIWPAAAGTAIFALHPLQTEPIAWATGMKDLLSGLLGLAAVWRYIVAVQAPSQKKRRKNYVAATVLFAAALLAKPSTVVIPILVATIDFVLYRRPVKTIFKWIWPWLVLSLLATGLAMQIQKVPAVFTTPLWTRPLVALDSLAFYIYKLVLPFYLSFDYGRTPAAVLSEPALHHPLYWTWILPVTVALIIWRIRKREVTLGALMFFFCVLPVLGLTPFAFQYYSTVADRFVYLGMLGIAVIAAFILSNVPHRPGAIVTAVVLVILSSLSFVQAGVWYDSQSLYENGAASASRGSAVHFAIVGQYEDMVAHAAWRRAQQAQSINDVAEYKKQIAIAAKTFDQAIEHYEASMNMEPKDGIIYDQLGEALAFRARWDEAIDVQKRRIANQANLSPALREPSDVLYDTLGMLCTQAKHYDQAVEAFNQSLKFNPKNSEVEDRRNKAMEKLGTTQPSTMPSA